ncbi:MAG: FecR domain-containing protein [Candidatus Eremiobacterota bacterium]
MRNATRSWTAAWLALAFVSLASPLPAEEQDLIKREQGKVATRTSVEAPDWMPVNTALILRSGHQARTYAKSLAKCTLARVRVTLWMGPQSTMTVQDMLDEAQTQKVRGKLESGSVRTHVLPGARRFEIETPNAVLAARGTEWWTQYGKDPAVEVVADASSPDSVVEPDSSSAPVELARFDLGGALGETRCAVTRHIVDVTARQTGYTAAIPEHHTCIVDHEGIIHVDPVAAGCQYGGAPSGGPFPKCFHFIGDTYQLHITDGPQSLVLDLGEPEGAPAEAPERPTVMGEGADGPGAGSELSPFHSGGPSGSPQGTCSPGNNAPTNNNCSPPGGGMPGCPPSP